MPRKKKKIKLHKLIKRKISLTVGLFYTIITTTVGLTYHYVNSVNNKNKVIEQNSQSIGNAIKETEKLRTEISLMQDKAYFLNTASEGETILQINNSDDCKILGKKARLISRLIEDKNCD